MVMMFIHESTAIRCGHFLRMLEISIEGY